MAKTTFTARDIPRLVPIRDYHYQTTIVAAIQKGFAHGCDYVTALALFKVGLSIGVIEQNPRDPDEYRILSPTQQEK
jgi:hypothetical protein